MGDMKPRVSGYVLKTFLLILSLFYVRRLTMNNLRPTLRIKTILNPMKLLSIAVLIATLFSGMVTFAALADAPAVGTVVEGQSVPGIALGATRAQVEAAYGDPKHCQDIEVGGDLAWCSYPVEGGGSVSVRYQGADGRYATNSPDDVSFQIGWSASSWTTTAGVNIPLASADRQAVADAYPNAEVTYGDRGQITRVEDSQLGIVVRWIQNFYMFPDTVSMAIYTPPEVLPEGSSIHVAGIDWTIEKIKSRRHVKLVVSVQGEQGQPVSGATVVSTWTYPRGATQTVTDVTSTTGYAFFELYDARNGTWTLTVDDVILEGHPFDRQNSQLSVSFRVK
jgi:hypothetical protein